jgi:hypothetical protein
MESEIQDAEVFCFEGEIYFRNVSTGFWVDPERAVCENPRQLDRYA